MTLGAFGAFGFHMSFHYRCWLECEIADGSLRLRPRCLPLGVLEPFAIREQSPQLPSARTCRNQPHRACRGRSALFILCSEKWNPVLESHSRRVGTVLQTAA